MVAGSLRSWRRALLLAGLMLAALPVAPALADTTVGQTGGGYGVCFGQALAVDTNYEVPSDGTINSFSFESIAANKGQQLEFVVLRPTSTAGDYTVVGKTDLVALEGTGLETFSANIPAQGHDVLGWWQPTQVDNCSRDVGSGGGFVFGGAPDPSVGDTVSLPDRVDALDLNLSASLATTTPTLSDLLASVNALDYLPKAFKNDLVKKLNEAQKRLDAGKTREACNKLDDFIDKVAHERKKITAADADKLITDATAVRTSLAC
jgi:hypothetical protein